MFDIEQSIAEWRRQMVAAGIAEPEPLNELEMHLRADIASLVKVGKPEPEAFELARSRLGSGTAVRLEFDKISTRHIWPVKIGMFVWLACVILQTVEVIGFWSRGDMNLLGAVQFMIVVAGYGAAFIAGCFGICLVCFQAFGAMSPARRQSLNRAVDMTTWFAAVLVILAMGLGMMWARSHPDLYAQGWRHARAAGCLCVCVWLVAVSAILRLARASDRAKMLMAIGSGIVVHLAAYYPVILQAVRGGGMGNHWIFLSVLAVEVFFLGLGCATKGSATSRFETPR